MDTMKRPVVHVSATGLPDAWYKLVKEVMAKGALKRRFYGKPVNTLDVISITEISHPLLEPLLHPDFPTKEKHLAEYEKQWEPNYDWIKQGFEYNYGHRLRSYPISHEITAYTQKSYTDNYYHHSPEVPTIDQLKVIREKISSRIKKGGECLVSNRDQAITWKTERIKPAIVNPMLMR